MMNDMPTGAGVIPIAHVDGQWMALLHRKIAGRKVGHLIDFTGTVEAGDVDSIGAAARECAEETYGFLSPANLSSHEALVKHCQRLVKCRGDPRDDPAIQPSIEASIAMLDRQMRSQGNTLCAKSTYCHIFFTEVPYFPVEELNEACRVLTDRHVREFHWVPVEELQRHSEIEVEGRKLALWPRITQQEVIASLDRITTWAPGSPETSQDKSLLRFCF